MTIDAGVHFAKGLRTVYFAFAYIGWFVSPYVLDGDHGVDFPDRHEARVLFGRARRFDA